jgi:hypothetical protein
VRRGARCPARSHRCPSRRARCTSARADATRADPCTRTIGGAPRRRRCTGLRPLTHFVCARRRRPFAAASAR